MPLVQRNQEVQALAPNRANHPLAISVRHRAPNRCLQHSQAEAVQCRVTNTRPAQNQSRVAGAGEVFACRCLSETSFKYFSEYVLAHEIAHVLQGVARHSDSGVMRARWTDLDYQWMSKGALKFATEDVQLIRHHLLHTDSTAAPGPLTSKP
jgi:hypothetical protein